MAAKKNACIGLQYKCMDISDELDRAQNILKAFVQNHCMAQLPTP